MMHIMRKRLTTDGSRSLLATVALLVVVAPVSAASASTSGTAASSGGPGYRDVTWCGQVVLKHTATEVVRQSLAPVTKPSTAKQPLHSELPPGGAAGEKVYNYSPLLILSPCCTQGVYAKVAAPQGVVVIGSSHTVPTTSHLTSLMFGRVGRHGGTVRVEAFRFGHLIGTANVSVP